MDELKYENKIFRRRSGKWVDSLNIAVPFAMQSVLNREFTKTLDLSQLPVEYLISEGDIYKENAEFSLAIKYYEEATIKCDEERLSYILPRISSCYRKSNMPQKAIELFTYAKEKYGQKMITHVLLTTAGAAYCDMKEFEKAKKCCDRACAMCDGKCSDELISVYARIKRELK